MAQANDGVSLTVPDQTMTIPELLERYTRGQDIPILDGVYLSEVELDPGYEDFDKMDFVDKLELAGEIRDQMLQQQREKLEAEAAHKAEMEAQIQADRLELEKLREAQAEGQKP